LKKCIRKGGVEERLVEKEMEETVVIGVDNEEKLNKYRKWRSF